MENDTNTKRRGMIYSKKSMWLVVVLLTTMLTIIVAILSLWDQWPSDQRTFLVLLSGIAVLSLAGMGTAVFIMYNLYITPLKKLAEETILVTAVNPSLRIEIQGGKPVMRLAQIIREKAEQFEEAQKHTGQKINLAYREAEHERDILASIISELPEGILICNAEGQILLYNKQAKTYLEGNGNPSSGKVGTDHAQTALPGPFIGLGRSVFGVLDKTVIVHALDRIAQKLDDKEANATSTLIVPDSKKRPLRAEMVPILNHRGMLTGFILIFEDIIREIETDSQVGFLLQSLTGGIRHSLRKMMAGLEALLEQPHMDSIQQNGLKSLIHREAQRSCALLAETSQDYNRHVRIRRPLVQMLGRDLLAMLKTKALDSLGINIKIVDSPHDNWIMVDCYSLLLAVLFLLARLRDEIGTDQFSCKLEREGVYANLDLFWFGQPLKIQTLRSWESEVVVVGKEGLPSTLREVIAHHGAKMWPATLRQAAAADMGRDFHAQETSETKSGFRLFLPDVQSSEPETLRKIMVVPESRPAFYDFDLFSQPGQTPELDNRLLTELTYTVFDTETTGLFPKVGDEIISLGAVRIVNGRLLRGESFDQLINPKRCYWQGSVPIHGIQPEMLESQPTIDEVLPLFHRFAEGSILVAHNAAFDLKMLQMKEASSGVTFINPVLDTLLLSALVHPAQDHHTLEAIAERFGVRIVGRHTALGDALATAEIFLKLIPLLAQMGIETLGAARLASQKTYYARFKY